MWGEAHWATSLWEEVGHTDQTLPWLGVDANTAEQSPTLRTDCILPGLRKKCLGRQLRWQDLTTTPGTCPATKVVDQRANICMGTVPGSSQKKTKERTGLCTAGWKPALQDRFPMLQKGLGAWSGTQSSRQDLVLWGQQGKHEPMPHVKYHPFLPSGHTAAWRVTALGFLQCVKLYARPREMERNKDAGTGMHKEVRSTGNSLVVQGLRLCTSIAYRTGSTPGLGIKIPQAT